MKNRLFSGVFAAILLASTLAITGSSVVTATPRNCQADAGASYSGGLANRSVGGNGAYGVMFSINPGTLTDFGPCTQADAGSGAFAWGAIVPNSGWGEDAIIQLGVSNCIHPLPYPPAPGWSCNTYPQYRYFYAWGGCNGATPYPRDLGVADGGPHDYRIQYYVSDNTWRFFIDGVEKGSRLKHNSSPITCWDDTVRRVAFEGEEWEQSSSMGTSTDKLHVHALKYRNVDGGTYYAISTSSCDNFGSNGDAYGHCTVTNGNDMFLWDDSY